MPAQYVMQPHLQQVEVSLTQKKIHTRNWRVILRLQMMPSTDPTMQFAGSMIPQLTTHMSALQLGTSGSVIIKSN
jgi:hypothetical protein